MTADTQSIDSPVSRKPTARGQHPILRLLAVRVLLGAVTLWVVSVIVFAATQVLPGNAATAILGHSATPAQVKSLEQELHLNRSIPSQYFSWASGIVTGHPGKSLVNGLPVWDLVGPSVINSVVLVVASGVIGAVIGIGVGALAAMRRDSFLDQATSAVALTVIALPEFVVAIALVIVFATVLWTVLPAVSTIPPGTYAWSEPRMLILPVSTLVIVIVPYIFRMTRGATIEALASEYVELARLKGLHPIRIVLTHALRNAVAPVVQVLGLTFLYLAGGIVVVEYVFAYPGIGQSLVSAVNNRDIPTVQLVVLLLAGFYVVVNIVSDVVALLATPPGPRQSRLVGR